MDEVLNNVGVEEDLQSLAYSQDSYSIPTPIELLGIRHHHRLRGEWKQLIWR